jgi:MFS family permease
MIEGKVGNPDVRWAALFAYAAGITSTLANLFLIAFFVLQANNPVEGASFGTANDLVGSLGTAFMIPVALALSAWLPDRTTTTITQIVGLSSMALLVVCGPLLVLGVIEFEVQALIAIGAWALLSLWLFLVNRWLRSSRDLPTRVAWFGELMGTLVLAAGAVAGLGLLLPWMSWAQLVVFGVGGVLAVVGMLGTPIWFLLLGRHVARL